MTTNLFTYGILMSDAACYAKLAGYRLDFGYHATVVEEQGGVTWGGLVKDVTPGMLARYDSIEGVRSGYYTRREVAVATEKDGPVRAWLYVMNQADLGRAKAEMGEAEHEGRPFPLGSMVQRMHHEYAMLGAPIWAHDELDYRVARWCDEVREGAASAR